MNKSQIAEILSSVNKQSSAVVKVHSAIYNLEHVKEALTRGAFLSLALKAPVAMLSGKEGLKQLSKATSSQQSAMLGSKAMSKVTGVDLLPLSIKADFNAKLLDQVKNNALINRRKFLKQRTLDSVFGHTPAGQATKSLAPVAPGLLSTTLKTLAQNLL